MRCKRLQIARHRPGPGGTPLAVHSESVAAAPCAGAPGPARQDLQSSTTILDSTCAPAMPLASWQARMTRMRRLSPVQRNATRARTLSRECRVRPLFGTGHAMPLMMPVPRPPRWLLRTLAFGSPRFCQWSNHHPSSWSRWKGTQVGCRHPRPAGWYTVCNAVHRARERCVGTGNAAAQAAGWWTWIRNAKRSQPIPRRVDGLSTRVTKDQPSSLVRALIVYGRLTSPPMHRSASRPRRPPSRLPG